MSKYTPGKCNICNHSLVCPTHGTLGILEANARLIASAPELLEACKQAEIEVNKWHSLNITDNDTLNSNNAWKCLKIIQQAIAKAEGK